ncbi:MAG TPA: ABC transporter ATP-binding protein [Spirochaetaceae bacterium]|nr:ABC transporter ATP-binding protein [Spirochaetaceae bacterium]
MNRPPILVAEGITVGYHRGSPILREIFINLERGKILAVIGPNGVGKSTLFKALSGELPLFDGVVRLFIDEKPPGTHQDMHKLSPRKRALHVARVLQNEQPAWAVPVSDYVEAGLFAREGWFGGDQGGAKGLVKGSLERMGIADLARRLVTELSGGEFRRVVIARALVQNPDVFLLDEPTADLDMAHQMETLAIMRDLAHAGKAVAFSVHDLNQASMAADEILLLAEGRIAAVGSPEAVLSPETIEKAYGMRVIVKRHPTGGVPHIVLDPPWLGQDRVTAP